MAAQYDAHLTGHVLDERTGEHLPYVNIQIKGTNIGTVTDESGHYLLQDLPIGRQTVIFSFVGYETLELPVTLEQDRTVELKAAIREVSKQLDGVVVTANRYATKRQEAATIVNVLSPKLFETTAVACMAEAMSFQPGLRVENSCSNCGKTELRIVNGGCVRFGAGACGDDRPYRGRAWWRFGDVWRQCHCRRGEYHHKGTCA